MQQFLNDPKNRPIVYGAAAVLMVAAIAFILFQLGIFGGGQSPYVPPTVTAANPPQGGPPGVPAGTPPGSPPPAAAPPQPTQVAQNPGSPAPSPTASPASGKPGQHKAKPTPAQPAAALNKAIKAKKLAALAKAAPTPPRPSPAAAPAAAPGAPGVPTTPAPTQVAVGVPNPRRDPFAPYVDLAALIARVAHAHPPRPRVENFALPLTITNYSSPVNTTTVPVVVGTTQPAALPASTSTVTLSGVMLGTGAYAIVNSNGQSVVLQPGDQLPNGGGTLYSIQSDSISVKVNGQLVKVPITAGQNANATPAATPNGSNS